MDIANELATYLDNAGFGTVGTDIFVGQIPEDTNGIWVEHIGGQLNNYVPIEEAALNIFIKSTKASTAVITLNNIKDFIHRMHSTSITNAYVYTFLVIGDVEDMSRDLEYAREYKLTVQVVYRNTAIIS